MVTFGFWEQDHGILFWKTIDYRLQNPLFKLMYKNNKTDWKWINILIIFNQIVKWG